MGLAACRTKPAAVVAEPDLPRYTGAVGQLERGGDFIRFIDAHNRQRVALDLTIAREDFEGGEQPGLSFFVVYDDCANLRATEKPSRTACTGVEYSIPHPTSGARPLFDEGGAWRLRGFFRVDHAPGEHQGLMSVTLDPGSR